MRFALEPYSEELVREMRPLWEEHHDEIPQLDMPLDPDLETYDLMQKSGTLRIFTARLGGAADAWDSMLVGYQIFFVMNHPHRRYSLEATQDILYLEPEVRKGIVGVKFIRWCDEQLKAEGVKTIFHQISAKNDFGKIFTRMGYELMDLTYARRVA